MSRDRLLALGVIGAVALLAAMAARDADAIPAFARKYQFSCSTCHAPFPRLKPYGEEFMARGYRLEDPSKEPARATYDIGDPLLLLPRDLPLAVRIDGYASWKQHATAESDVEWPWVFKILGSGPISNKVSYFFYFLTEKGEVVGLEDIFLQFNGVFGLPVDLNVGQYQVSDPMFKREHRLERFDYEILTTHVGDVGVDLTYDRGLAATWHAPGKVDAVFQVVNGNGSGMANDFENFDRDTYKNFSLRVVRQFPGVRVGLTGYTGRERGSTGRTNTTTYLGPDLVVELGPKWQLSACYLERRDDDPFFTGYTGPEYVTRGGFGELHFFPAGQDGRWVLTALYNKVDSDEPGARRETASLTANYLLARNLRLFMEGGNDLEAEATRLSLGLVVAF
jgi:hypothetical protein